MLRIRFIQVISIEQPLARHLVKLLHANARISKVGIASKSCRKPIAANGAANVVVVRAVQTERYTYKISVG